MCANNIILIKHKCTHLFRGYFIWGIVTLFYIFDNLLNIFPGAMKPELSAAFSRSAADLGSLSACYLWAYGIMQIPAGILIDRFGPRIVLTIASFVCAVGCYIFSSAYTFSTGVVGRLLIGFGASFAVVGCSKIATTWFPPKRFALFMGLMVSVGMTGAAFGLSTINKIIHVFASWRDVVLFGSAISVSIAVLIWFFVRDRPEGPVPWSIELTSSNITKPHIGLFEALFEVISCRQAWYVSTYAGLMFVPTLAFGGMWGIPYLVEAHAFSQDLAGFSVGLIFIGWTFGGPIYGWFSDYIRRRKILMCFANITTLLVSLCIIYATHLSPMLIGTLMFLLGLFSSGFILAFAIMREQNRVEVLGISIGFINMLNTILGGAVFQYIIGKVLDWKAKDVIETEAGRIFSLLDYQRALLLLPVCLVVSLIALMFLKETYCKSKY